MPATRPLWVLPGLGTGNSAGPKQAPNRSLSGRYQASATGARDARLWVVRQIRSVTRTCRPGLISGLRWGAVERHRRVFGLDGAGGPLPFHRTRRASSTSRGKPCGQGPKPVSAWMWPASPRSTRSAPGRAPSARRAEATSPDRPRSPRPGSGTARPRSGARPSASNRVGLARSDQHQAGDALVAVGRHAGARPARPANGRSAPPDERRSPASGQWRPPNARCPARPSGAARSAGKAGPAAATSSANVWDRCP